MENYVITIARNYGSDGCAIAEQLAQKLNIRFLDKELLSLVSIESGASEALLEKADERVARGLLKGKYDPELDQINQRDWVSEDNLFRYQAQTLKKLVQKESFVVVGRAADFILQLQPHVFSVSIQSSFEDCVEGIMKRKFVDAKTAMKDVRRINKERMIFYRTYTGKDWNDPLNYDLCINSARFTREACIELIIKGANLKFNFDVLEDLQ